MASCFVIQPFDSGKFDKRYRDIYKPAIEAAGVDAYRVDHDPGVLVPIDAIEKGIRQASVCLADITTDNPNVWYELGYAFACERPVVMVCSHERAGAKYPFDIQHRTVLSYHADSLSDFDDLKAALTQRLQAILQMRQTISEVAASIPTSSSDAGITPIELLVLATFAGEVLPGIGIDIHSAKRGAERAGVTGVGFNVAVRKLKAKDFVRDCEVWDDDRNEKYDGLSVTNSAWDWIDANHSQFILHRAVAEPDPDDIPF